MVEVGHREVDRTRQLKLAPELVWNKPEERFRVAMEDVKQAISAPTSTAYVTATTTSAKSVGIAMTASGAPIVSSKGEEGRAGNAPPADVGTGVTTSETHDAAGPSLLSIPTLALDQAQHDHQHQQQVMVAASSLKVSVWSKDSVIGGRPDRLLGRATVPARYIDHPPGDVWLPLAGVSNSTSMTAPTTTSGEVNQKGVSGPTAGPEDADAPALSAVSEHPNTGAVIGNATAKKTGGTKSWSSGMFKRKGLRKGSVITEVDQHRAMTAGSVRVWLGKVRRGSLSGQQPGKGHAILRVHGASALRKVQFVVAVHSAHKLFAPISIRSETRKTCDRFPHLPFPYHDQADRHGSSDPKCFIVWNGENAGSTSTLYNTTDPCWDRDKEAFRLRLPLDRSLCQLHIDVWDMDLAGTKRG